MADGARRRTEQQGGGEGEIDLTPMLDVVFIMLIFFIVTSSFVKEPGVEIMKPQAVTTEACVRGTIIFAVDERGDIYYNKNKTTIDKVARLAEAAKKESPQANLVVQVDAETPTYVVEQLIDEVRPIMPEPPCISTDEEA